MCLVCVYSNKFHNFFAFESRWLVRVCAVRHSQSKAGRGWKKASPSCARDLSLICINWKLLSEKKEYAYKLKWDPTVCLMPLPDHRTAKRGFPDRADSIFFLWMNSASSIEISLCSRRQHVGERKADAASAPLRLNFEAVEIVITGALRVIY